MSQPTIESEGWAINDRVLALYPGAKEGVIIALHWPMLVEVAWDGEPGEPSRSDTINITWLRRPYTVTEEP